MISVVLTRIRVIVIDEVLEPEPHGEALRSPGRATSGFEIRTIAFPVVVDISSESRGYTLVTEVAVPSATRNASFHAKHPNTYAAWNLFERAVDLMRE